MTDNYREVCEQWRKKAQGFDYAERYAALGLSGWREQGDLPIRCFGRDYRICRGTAELVDCAAPQTPVDFSTAMLIYHLFYYSVPMPVLSRRWVPIREIRRAAPFERAFLAQTTEPFARAFDGRADALAEAGRRLGFRRLKESDVGLEADVFECLPIRLLFWDGDEEFPAQCSVLFDANSNDFLHEETVIMAGMELTARLRRCAQL